MERRVYLVAQYTWDYVQKFLDNYLSFSYFDCSQPWSLLLFLHILLDVISWDAFGLTRFGTAEVFISTPFHHYCRQVQKKKEESRPRTTFSLLVCWSFFYIPFTASPHPPLTLTPPLPRRSIGPAITVGKSLSAETISDWEDLSSHEPVFISYHAEFLGKSFISRMIFKASSSSYIFAIAICRCACSGGRGRGCPGVPDLCPFLIQPKLCPQILKPIYKKRFEKSV